MTLSSRMAIRAFSKAVAPRPPGKSTTMPSLSPETTCAPRRPSGIGGFRLWWRECEAQQLRGALGCGGICLSGTYAGLRNKDDRAGIELVQGYARLLLDVLDLDPNGNPKALLVVRMATKWPPAW